MNFLNNDYENQTRPDLNDPVPERGLKRWLFLFSNHFTRLMSLNLLFLVCCLPVVTIPASLCALTRVTAILWNTGSCSVWQDFWEAFRRGFFSRFLAVFLTALFPVSLCLWFFAFGMSSFGVGIAIVLIPVCLTALCYFLAYTAGLSEEFSPQNSMADTVRLAFFSVFRSPKRSLKLLAAPILLYALCLLSLHYSMIFVVFILFAGGQLALCGILSDRA